MPPPPAHQPAHARWWATTQSRPRSLRPAAAVWRANRRRGHPPHASASSPLASPDPLDPLSADYTRTMNAAMGSALTYDHARGINWTEYGHARWLHPRVIIGSCPQTPADIHRLASVGVGAVVCLQQGADWGHFGIDGDGLRAAARASGVLHYVVPVEDFSPSSLRSRLADGVVVLHTALHATASTATTVYVHCTAGLGRAPATALAHAAWVRGASLDAAAAELRAARPCNPRLAAVRAAAADMVLGSTPVPITLEVRCNRQGGAREAGWSVAGLDVGWDSSLPLTLNPHTGRRSLTRLLPPGRHEFKLIVTDPATGEDKWIAWPDWPVLDGGGGIMNNYVDVPHGGRGAPTPASILAEARLTRGDPNAEELAIIRKELAARRARAVAAASDPATRGVAGAARWLFERLVWPPR